MTEKASIKLSGKLGEVGFKKKRRFFQVTAKFGEIHPFVERRLYNGASGSGEQRSLIPANVTRLYKAQKDDEYTPTSWSLSLKKKHIDTATFHDNGTVTIHIDKDNKVPIIDGGHRDASYERLYSEWQKALEESGGEDDSKVQAVLNQDIPLVVYLEGDPKEDFINLNSSKPVNKAHTLSLQIRKNHFAGKDDEFPLKMAMETAKILNGDDPKKSFLTNYILFDSRTDRAPKMAMPITTVLGRGSSDIAGSIVGGGRIAIEFDKDATWLSTMYRNTYNIIAEKLPALLKPGKLLTPPPDGTKAGATLLIAIGNCVAYYLARMERETLDDDEVEVLVNAVNNNFDTDARGNTSADSKRKVIGSFAIEFFEGYNAQEEEPEHCDIPKGLVEILSAGTFGVDKLPKKSKATA